MIFCYSQSKGDEDDDDIYQTFVETMAPIQSEIAKAQTVRFYQIRIDKVDTTVGPKKERFVSQTFAKKSKCYAFLCFFLFCF